MGYTGRLLSVVVIWIVSLFWIIYLLITADHFREGWGGPAIAFAIILLSSFAGWQLGKQYDKVKYFSQKDDLTGAFNRRYLYYDTFVRLTRRADKHKQTLCVFLIDIDDLKEINDKYGHLDGDKVIQETASVLKRKMRKSDTIVRWGGDEFIVASPDTPQKDAMVILDKLNEEVGNCTLTKLNCPLRLSAGYALYPDDGKTLDELIQKADQRMYERKKASKAHPS